MVYKNDIPQSGDLVSVSQGDLLENFSQLYTCNRTDHVDYDNATVADRGKHEYARLRERVPPGTPLPTTGAGWGALYTKDDAGSTALYFMNDAGVSTKISAGGSGTSPTAFARFTETAAHTFTLQDAYNLVVGGIAGGGATTVDGYVHHTITFAVALPTANYCVVINGQGFQGGGSGFVKPNAVTGAISYLATGFTILSKPINTGAGEFPRYYHFVVFGG